MNSDLVFFQKHAKLLGVALTDAQLELFDRYQDELRRWNKKTNLVSETTSDQIITRHFLDSLTALQYITPLNACLLDIGSGAGFPGIPLKIALPSLKLYLLESHRKKISFLKHILRLLKLSDAFAIHDRTENMIRKEEYRETFDIVVSRAALKLPELLSLSGFFLTGGGLLITLKGTSVEAEMKDALSTTKDREKYEIYQNDITFSFLGPPRKIIIARKAK